MTAAGPYEQEPYLRAALGHEGATRFAVAAGSSTLVLGRQRDGSLRTPYGYPVPFAAPGRAVDVAGLCGALLALGAPARISLSPLGDGAALAAELGRRVPATWSRPICVTDLEADPLRAFGRRARRGATRAARDLTIRTGPLEQWFGGFYRAHMAVLGADRIYLFGDEYFTALAGAGHVLVTASDAAGPAVAALFLVHGGVAGYHLGARRALPAPVQGATNLVMLEGLRAMRRRGGEVAILGGGRSASDDDSLLAFKAGMATRVLARPVYDLVPAGVAA